LPASRLEFETLPHGVFLQRVSGVTGTTSLEARLGQGAFLALRLVDQLGPERPPVSDDAFHYQAVATDRFCRELRATGTEGAHVHGLVESAVAAWQRRDVRLVVPALFAYAHFLEDELRLEEAVDVLDTLIAVGADRVAPADAVAARLRMARVYRKMNQFDQADRFYEEAGELAAAAGDRHSELLSRIGRANTVLGRGNLRDAERRLRSIAAEAAALRDADAEARAQHGLAGALYYMGQAADAIWHLWRAFGLYGNEDNRVRALNDLGIMLLSLGDAAGAETALREVLRRGDGWDQVGNALIELMHCASYRRDRVGFARWRERCEARVDEMPANMRADFYLKQGIGHARFGHFRRAEVSMKRALDVATAHGLHEFEFRIERILAGLRDCERELAREGQSVPDAVLATPELREVSESLAQLAG
jgi:tetratricopeptide (TPR) repeat protein